MSYRDDWFDIEQLHRAAQSGNSMEVERLLIEGFNINLFDDVSRTPLHYAVEEQHCAVAALLMERGADVNAHDEEKIGETALSFAVQKDSVEMVKFLLMHGANPHIIGWMGATAWSRVQGRTDDVGKKIFAILVQYDA